MLYGTRITKSHMFDLFIWCFYLYNIIEIDCATYQNIWILDEYKFIGVNPLFFSGRRSILLYRCVGSSVSWYINILPFYLTVAQWRCYTCTIWLHICAAFTYVYYYIPFGQAFEIIDNIITAKYIINKK